MSPAALMNTKLIYGSPKYIDESIIDFLCAFFYNIPSESIEEHQKTLRFLSIVIKNLKKKRNTFQELMVLSYIACLGRGQERRKR